AGRRRRAAAGRPLHRQALRLQARGGKGPPPRRPAPGGGEGRRLQRPLRDHHPEVIRVFRSDKRPACHHGQTRQPRYSMAATLPPLDQLDPAEAGQPWRPSPGARWGRRWAAHLSRRAAFGAGREELREAEHLGPGGTLDLLLRGRPHADEVVETLTDVGGVAAARDDGGDQLRGWWLYCMLQGGHPLREKMTLFWHNHFATSIAKVQSPALMFRQNCLLREHALGKFGPFVQAISRDAAMLVWLDSNRNVKGKPNENYARELMELFTLGVHGGYTEKDVKEAARAFTGWHTDGVGFAFNPAAHDDGPKTVLGQTGAWDGG